MAPDQDDDANSIDPNNNNLEVKSSESSSNEEYVICSIRNLFLFEEDFQVNALCGTEMGDPQEYQELYFDLWTELQEMEGEETGEERKLGWFLKTLENRNRRVMMTLTTAQFDALPISAMKPLLGSSPWKPIEILA
ncbi:K-box region and MADS-box transcription factor family protein [Striga asiatica]|uniref:K-box region and MADS-box transcription factor family protein n=1 Tax=Striga asiatica TaxID=4170 RepID=A0A5A7RH57_STRAF|nr:K-box region and MADS-box transcription factor family protein [Striga asiatica]